MLNSPEHQQESLRPTLAKIIKATGLVVAALLFQGCDGKNPNEAMLQAVGSKVNTGTRAPENTSQNAEEIRRQCASAAAEEAGIRVGTEGLDVGEEFLLRDALTGQCLEEKGVVTPGN